MPKHLSPEFVESDDGASSRSPSPAPRLSKVSVSHSLPRSSHSAYSDPHKAKRSAPSDSSSGEEALATKSSHSPSPKKGKDKGKDQAKGKANLKEKEEVPVKKKKRSSISPEALQDGEGNTYYELGKNRRITARKWKNTLQVDIRETYDKGGETLPGKKGISLTVEQWDRLKKVISGVDDAVDKLS
ncbi:hypothetical protein JCM21900_003563 [Sporobolomyces salmonicolor]